MNSIRWQLFLRVSSEGAAEKVLRRLAQALGQGACVLECKRYWKDQTLFQAILTSPLAATDVPGTVLEALLKGAAVARRWTVSAPQFYEGGRWEFSGSADSRTISVPGVAEVDFQVGDVQEDARQLAGETGEEAPPARDIPPDSR